MDRTQKINDVREMLDYLEATPDLQLPWFDGFTSFPPSDSISEVARVMAPFTKEATETFFILLRDFGSITLRATFYHDTVCEKVVTGTEEIPEKITPAHTVDIVEWKCPDSLLKP